MNLSGSRSHIRRWAALAFFVVPSVLLATGEPYKPTPAALIESYQRAETIARDYTSRTFMTSLTPNWLDEGKAFWYRRDAKGGDREFVRVDSATGAKRPAFDHERLARALGEAMGDTVDAKKLPFFTIEFPDENLMRFDTRNQGWTVDLKSYALTKVAPKPRNDVGAPRPWSQDTWSPESRGNRAPDGNWTARVVDFNVRIKPKDGEEFTVTQGGVAGNYFSRLSWSPDSKHLLAVRVTPGDRKPVYLVESSPKAGGRAVLHERVYDLPGDKVDNFEIWVIDPAAKTAKPINGEKIDFGVFWQMGWSRDGRHFTYEKLDRGYGRWRIIEGDAVTLETRTLVDDDPETFFDSTTKYRFDCDSGEIVWRSERDGWGHLYITTNAGKTTQITKGPWVVRQVVKVDDKARTIVFTASGMNEKEDPYFLHYYRIKFDGTGLTPLTPAAGNHSVQFSPEEDTYVDTYSQLDVAPVHELRRAKDGKLIATLEKADISELESYGWNAPEPFVAKARDGKTDIWGVVYRPSNFDPTKSYAVIEDIYAGPQDSFVPKSFAAYRSMQSLAELGFIVVKIDGMGTRNRSKAFHDVCYKNLADAGLPDRILWMKALAAKYSYVDVNRVGVHGTSAGGQNGAGAVLFHPEFYKVAVASCGCHDNRMDKIWWNEQWMGLMGPHYEAQSNITNAAKLEGKLMLIVGEMDSNVPPESTFRLGDALEKAGKDFDLVVIQGANHTNGGPYGEHKRRDFFVRNLLGVEPPNWTVLANADRAAKPGP